LEPLLPVLLRLLSSGITLDVGADRLWYFAGPIGTCDSSRAALAQRRGVVAPDQLKLSGFHSNR